MMIKMERILTFYNNDLANFDCFYIIKGSLTFYDSQNERGGGSFSFYDDHCTNSSTPLLHAD